ncbi:MAG: aldo/keto reductase, partial [Armatimonadota bacterium]|nr:aldo/keto reductase [Armatimonadota bacterium]
WRQRFFDLCQRYGVSPAEACVQFGLSGPGVVSIALNTSKPNRVAENARLVQAEVPPAFWQACKEEGLISRAYPYVG